MGTYASLAVRYLLSGDRSSLSLSLLACISQIGWTPKGGRWRELPAHLFGQTLGFGRPGNLCCLKQGAEVTELNIMYFLSVNFIKKNSKITQGTLYLSLHSCFLMKHRRRASLPIEKWLLLCTVQHLRYRLFPLVAATLLLAQNRSAACTLFYRHVNKMEDPSNGPASKLATANI